MRTKLTVVTALAGTLLATCLAQATSVPVLRGVSGVTVSVLVSGVTMADATALAHITTGTAWLASTPAGTRT